MIKDKDKDKDKNKKNKKDNNQYKNNNFEISVEKHNTAAWANIDSQKSISKVTIPDEKQVKNAKDYVEDNQK